jgi:GNAT superfamily N-acetyltransferase
VTACGILLGLCFEDEGWSAALVGVLDDPVSRRRFLRNVSISDFEAYAAHESALAVDAWDTSRAGNPQPVSPLPIDPAFDNLPAGTVLFDIAGAFTPAKYAASWERSMQRGCDTLSAKEAGLIKERARLLEGMESGSWCARAFPDGYSYIAAICVNPHYRGLGVLSALFDPIVARAKELRMPLCLEAYAERPRDIYAHKGFEVVDAITNEELLLTQYCMVKKPE